MLCFFGPETCGILVPQPGIKPSPSALEGNVLTTGPRGKSLIFLIRTLVPLAQGPPLGPHFTLISPLKIHLQIQGLPRWLGGKESACQCRRCRFDSWVRNITWRRKWQTAPVFLPGESHGQRSLAGYSPWGRKKSKMT